MTSRILFSVVLVGSVALGWRIGGADRVDPRSAVAAEAVRLRAHFAQVERELLARDVSMLSPRQRDARADQIERLRGYAAAGNFPRNDFHPGRRVPYFRDGHGNLCAMAFLIAASGRGDIVDHIARTRNYAYIADLADEPGLAGWLEENGLTLAEAARIQPAYDGPSNKVDGTYLKLSAATTALSGLSIVLNARSAERLNRNPGNGVLGIATGLLSIANGALPFVVDDDPTTGDKVVGGVNLAVGTVAFALGVRALNLRKRAPQSSFKRLSIGPAVYANARPAIGLQGGFRF